MYNIAVLGDRDSIFGFTTLGLDIYPLSDVVEAGKTLKLLAGGNYAVIYITENWYQLLEQQISEYQNLLLPAIVPIPGVMGNTGIGIARLKKAVEQAVGSDIIFQGENERTGETHE